MKSQVCFSAGVNGYAIVEAATPRQARALVKKQQVIALLSGVLQPTPQIETVEIEEDYEFLMGGVFQVGSKTSKPLLKAQRVPRGI